MVYLGWLGSNPLTVWCKYLGQCLKTWWILFAERPDAVLVMSPPVFAVMAVYCYCVCKRVPYVIDAHTAAFLHPRWQHLQWLQHFFCRRAATTIVTNEHLADRIREGGGHATLVRDVPVLYDKEEPFAFNGKLSIAAVCSFNPDEPIEEIFGAAQLLPDVQFYMTGDLQDLDPDLAKKAPPNVTLTGFLSIPAYGSLLTNADAVLTLTTRDHTMLRGAYEAIYQGTPVIISHWPLLQEAFTEGTIHVENTAQHIANAIRLLQANRESFKAGALSLRQKKLQEWEQKKQALFALLENKQRSSCKTPEKRMG
jgi:glycosyltransferase involved in cell wall biosynthesis